LQISGTQADRFERTLIFNGQTNRKIIKYLDDKIVALEYKTTTLDRKWDSVLYQTLKLLANSRYFLKHWEINAPNY
jgi:hypothetical protein